MKQRLTSESAPIRVDFLPQDLLGLRGRLGMTFAPGKKDDGVYARWDRDLDADLARLRDVYRLDVLVCLLEDHELPMLEIPELVARAEARGLEVLRHRIPDGSIPADEGAFMALASDVLARLADGRNVVVHCRGGLGRTGVLAATCLVAMGLHQEQAIGAVRAARERTIETERQEHFVRTRRRGGGPERARVTPAFDRVRASLVGGAIGDALGFPIEFESGPFAPDAPERVPRWLGHVRVSDDTQMTLFTAEALVRARSRRTEPDAIARACWDGYQRWLTTQRERFEEVADKDGWLQREVALWARRAPGNTCLSALSADPAELPTVGTPPNGSKGCGAVMRSAPFGLALEDRVEAFRAARDAGVLTHGHPSGYLSAAYFAAVVWDLARGATLEAAMREADALLAVEPGAEETVAIVLRARDAARGGPPSRAAIESLGGGWVGEEALAIALACAANVGPSREEVADALWRSVAHAGDSDSTGSLTGNLLGAMHGTVALPKAWHEEVELGEVVDRAAHDLHAAWAYGAVLDRDSYPE